MAIFHITNANSVTTNTNGEHAFDSDTPGADSLIVDAGAYLAAGGAGGIGALLAATKGWKVIVNGSISSDTSNGMLLGSTISNSTITIGVSGEVTGTVGIGAESPVAINNAGSIIGGMWGINLADAGRLTLNNSGLVRGGTYSISDNDGLSADRITNSGTLDGDVFLRGRDDTLTSSGLIIGDVDTGTGNDRVTNSGEIRGSVHLRDGDDKFTNAGLVKGAVDLGSGDTGIVINSGTIEFSIQGGTGKDTVSNTGTINANINADDGNDAVTNKGTIGGNINLDAGNDTMLNTWIVAGNINFGDGDDRIASSGFIGGNVNGGLGNDKVTNSGTIAGLINLGNGDDRLTTRGLIEQDVLAEDGADTVTNSGSILGNIYLGDGLNKLTNTGTIGNNVIGGADRDVVTNTDTIGGYIDLRGGDDSYTGGSKVDLVIDNAGSDSVKLGSGDDWYRAANDIIVAADGSDIIDGGAGRDMYDASLAFSGVVVNLDAIAHDLTPFDPGQASIAARNAIVNGTKDIIRNFEDVIGSQSDDVVYGSSAGNFIQGVDGADFLFGFGGNDTLLGGLGNDSLCGGLGKDMLNGGDGADHFRFTSIKDSGIALAARDLIEDFESGIDIIDLAHIDAISVNGAGDDTFNFIGGQSFSGVAGQLRVYATADGQIVEGDVNGDGNADFSIELYDPTHAITLTTGDFLL
jgi:hypothetical protein